jgi:hypothetical protein
MELEVGQLPVEECPGRLRLRPGRHCWILIGSARHGLRMPDAGAFSRARRRRGAGSAR